MSRVMYGTNIVVRSFDPLLNHMITKTHKDTLNKAITKKKHIRNKMASVTEKSILSCCY